MQNSRLLSILLALSPDELRSLRKFLLSPYFNQRADVVALFDLLATSLKPGKAEPTKEAICQQLYPNEPYDDQRLRHVMSFLNKLVEQFLAHEAVGENGHFMQLQLAESFRRRNLPEHFQRSLIGLKKAHEDSPFRHADHYWEGYEIQLQDYLFTATTRRATSLNLQEIGDQLDLAYLALKLRQTCVALSHQAVFKADYDFGLLPEVLGYLERENLLELPAIGVYYHCYQALVKPSELAHFQGFKRMLYQHGDDVPVSEIRDLYLLAINICIRRYNEGSAGFLEEEFELYKAALEKKVLLVNGVLSRFTYQNVVTLALVLGEFEWVEQFLSNYTQHLERRFREANHSFNLARLEYFRHRYDRALDLLQKSDYEDLLLNLSAKTLLLKIYYETAEFNALDSLLDSMSNFVRRKKAIGYHRDNYLNLVKLTKKLLQTPHGDKEARAKLANEITETKSVAERGWLLEKLE
ncbi:MAG: hypothetical protein IT258_03280 [Saprospiraceae bacterium]|nr:hypothetical protein [Saprospiraceae bacterium]